MIIYKSSEEIRAITKSNQIVGKILLELKKMIEPGVTTIELDEYAEKRALEEGARPAFKGYRGFPASLCTSINEEIVHGIPSSRQLKSGDIISLDFGVEYNGLYGDAAITCSVGDVTEKTKELITAAEESFYKGFEAIETGKRLSDISHAIQTHVESHGFSIIRTFVGHGIGYSLHEDPQIPNFGAPGHGPVLKPGMVMAIEPMISMGDWHVEILEDDWTAITRDRSLSAHYEHSLAITENGPIILSLIDEQKMYGKERKETQNA